MLRTHRDLKPRISNHLAVFSALLLLVTCFVGTSDSMPSSKSWTSEYVSVKEELVEPARDSVPTLRKNARKVSLMFFH